MSDDLAYLSLVAATRLMRARELSPVDLARALLARIDAHDGRIHAFLTVDRKGALDAARRAERALAAGEDTGPLTGVPLAIKDIVDVAGQPTTAGSRVLAGNVATTDATLVATLRAAGASILGKTNTHEFAYGVITSPTRNPWDPTRIPGGSSGGSAAALAAGMAPGAIGTDTAGSIRLPAALCGVVGLKPTYGRVDLHGVIPLSWSLDHGGPLARTVADVALLFDILTGSATRDLGDNPPASPFAEGDDIRRPRVGVPRAYFYERLEPAVANAVDAALRTLESLGAEVREVDLPDVGLTFAVGRAVQRPEASAYHRERLRATPELYGPEVRVDLELGELFLATDYVHAQRVRASLRDRWLAVMDDVDLLVTPTVPIVAPPATDDILSGPIKGTLLRNTYPFSLVGFPSLSLPCGMSPDGLPVGLQLTGRPFAEATVLRIGQGYEQATPWHAMRPLLTR